MSSDIPQRPEEWHISQLPLDALQKEPLPFESSATVREKMEEHGINLGPKDEPGGIDLSPKEFIAKSFEGEILASAPTRASLIQQLRILGQDPGTYIVEPVVEGGFISDATMSEWTPDNRQQE